MKKIICWIIVAMLLLSFGCGSENTGSTQQEDMWDLLMGGSVQSEDAPVVRQRSHIVTVNGDAISCCDYVYDVLKDGTARIDIAYSIPTDWILPETIDGYTVSTLGRDLLSESDDLSLTITIPDCIRTLEGNPFDGSRIKDIIISDTHPTLEVVDGVLFSKPDHRLVRAFFHQWYNYDDPLDGYYIPDGTLIIEDHAFSYAAVSYGTVFIPDSVTTLGKNPFAFCNPASDQGRYKIAVSDDHPVLEIVDNMLYSKQDRRLICCADAWDERQNDRTQRDIPDGTEIIDDFAFLRMGKLETVSIPASVNTIGTNPFYGMDIEVLLSDANTAFELQDGLLYDIAQKRLVSCPSKVARDITIKNGTETIGAYAFAYRMVEAYGMEAWHISVPNSVKEIGDYAFCGNWFMTCDIPASIRRIGVCAYAKCWQIDNDLVFGGGVVIEDGAFSSNTGENSPGVTGLTIVGEGGAIIGNFAFGCCRGFTTVTITEGESYIGDKAFLNSGLQEVTLAEGLVSIGDDVFYGCGSLYGSSLVLPKSLEHIGGLYNSQEIEYDKELDLYRTTWICTMNIYVTKDSYAEQFCKENGIPYQYNQ